MKQESTERALDLTDGRAGCAHISVATADAISRARKAALERRGIKTLRFNRMDFAGSKWRERDE